MSNIIREPGKFEGEPTYIRYYWDLYLDGGSDEQVDDNGILYDVFMADDKDRARIGDPDAYAILLSESDQGFASITALTESDYVAWIDAITPSDREDNEN